MQLTSKVKTIKLNFHSDCNKACVAQSETWKQNNFPMCESHWWVYSLHRGETVTFWCIISNRHPPTHYNPSPLKGRAVLRIGTPTEPMDTVTDVTSEGEYPWCEAPTDLPPHKKWMVQAMWPLMAPIRRVFGFTFSPGLPERTMSLSH